MSLTRAFLLVFGLLPFMACLYGQGYPTGLPQMTNYTPVEYRAGAQNWAAMQDHRGVMFFANGKGLLSFDGRHWKLLTLPNKSLVRALASDQNGRIYIGGQQLFGYLEAQADGQLRIVALSDSLPADIKNFDGVPNIHVTSQGVIFHTLKRSYIYKDGKLTAISPTQGFFHLSFYVHEKVYIHEPNVGMHELRDGSLQPTPGGAFFADKRVEMLLPFRGDTLLVATEQHGLFLWKGDRSVPFTRIPEKYQRENPIFSGLKLPNGRLVLGTHQDGLILLDSLGVPQQRINTGSGLSNNLIWGMSADHQGNLWLCLDNGIAHIGLNAPFSYLKVGGSILSVSLYQDRLFLGTTQGIFSSAPASESSWGQAFFNAVPNTEEQAWQFMNTGNELLSAHIRGILQLTPKQRWVWQGYAWSLVPVPNHPEQLLGGTDKNGLVFLKKQGSEWQVSHFVEGFSEVARYLAFEGKDTIWVSHSLKGIYRLVLSHDQKRIAETKLYTASDGLPSNALNFVFAINNEAIFATEKGIYRFDKPSGRFVPNHKFLALPKVRKLVADVEGNIWFSTGEDAGVLKLNEGRYEPYRGALKKLKGIDIYSISPVGKESIFFGTPQGLIQYNPKMARLYDAPFVPSYQALIRQVSFAANDSVLFAGAFNQEGNISLKQPESQIYKFPYQLNSLKFLCSSAWYEDPQWMQFRYYLEGFDERWSEWSTNPERIYTNLPPGTYTFYVKTKNAYELLSEEASYTFVVLAPWYRTWLAYFIYLLMLGGSIWAGIKLYTRRLQKEKQRLEFLVQERTEEIVAQKEEIGEQNKVLAIQKSELETLNEEKNHLIGMLAHDLRNPLHQIKGTVDIFRLKNPKMPDDDKRLLHIIESAVHHQNSMITKILDLEAIESKKTNVVLEKLDLGLIVRVVADSFQGRAADKQIEFVIDVPDRPFPAMLDRSFAQQVFENLVSNALKFSSEGKRIFITVEEAPGNTLYATIKDEGPGISAEDQKKLFGKFQKLSARPTAGEKSTGLGLSIVKRYVEAMGGQVRCESQIGQGAAFIVIFDRVL